MKNTKILSYVTASAVLLFGIFAGALWFNTSSENKFEERTPYEAKVEGLKTEVIKASTAKSGLIRAGDRPDSNQNPFAPVERGSWPQFRGPNRDGVSLEKGLLKTIPKEGLKQLWKVKTGEGYAGAVINRGRVYFIDYDQEIKADSIRCLSFADGEEIWKYNYPVIIKRNHGMSRTVPAVNDKYLVTIGPMGHVTALKADTGEFLWQIDLVKDYGAKVPEWYAGECPLIDGGLAIIGVGGKDILMMAVDLATGKVRWFTKNTAGHKMTHASISVLDFPGEKQYIWPASLGAVSVSAKTGELLWTDASWKINIANVPTPVIVGNNKVLLTGGYDVGAKYVEVSKSDDKYSLKELFRVKAGILSSQQHTPVFYEGNFYGIIQEGQIVCVDQSGKLLWKSGPDNKFGLGPFFIADGMLLVLHDMNGMLSFAEASPNGYKEVYKTKVYEGHEAWAPMALAEGKLIIKDLTEMICLRLK